MSIAFSSYGVLAIVWPYISFYVINPDNTSRIGDYFTDQIAINYHYLVNYQTVIIPIIVWISLLFFKNPPQDKSKASVFIESFISKRSIKQGRVY